MISVSCISKSKNTVFMVFLIPAFILYTVFFIYPSVSSIYYGFTDWAGFEKNIKFIGIENYIKLLYDERFLAALKNTFLVCVILTVIQNALALVLAVGLDIKIKTRNILRTIFFMPSVLSALVIGFVWSYIYSPFDGLLNAILDNIGLTPLERDWLGDPKIALYSIMFIVLWQSTGYAMVIYLAGLQSIPKDYYEASAIDGANAWHKFTTVTFPLIAPSFTVNILLSVIGSLKIFDIIYATTMGGPGYATETITTIIFLKAFGSENEFGYATAIATVLFIIILMISSVLVKFLRAREIEI